MVRSGSNKRCAQLDRKIKRIMKIVITTKRYILTILCFVLANSVYSYIVVSARANLFPPEGATRKYISIAYTLIET